MRRRNRPALVRVAVSSKEHCSTKAKILDGAEANFARLGYFAATLRTITEEAKVPLNLARYHFGTKAELFQAVIARRAESTCGMLEQALSNALLAEDTDPQEAVINAMVSMSLRRLEEGDAGWRNYFQLLAHLSLLMDHPELLKPFLNRYAVTLGMYRKALQRASPDADEATVDWALHFVQVLLGHAALDLGLVRRVGGCPSKNIDWTELRLHLVAFALGGLRTQIARQGKNSKSQRSLTARGRRRIKTALDPGPNLSTPQG